MVKVVRIHAHGGPEVLRIEDLPLAEPGSGQVVLRNEAVGLNFFDTYQREGIYPTSLSRLKQVGPECSCYVRAMGVGLTHRLRLMEGCAMGGMLAFQERYGSEAGCIEALARLRWPQGYVCAGCGERRSYQLKTRPRIFECACCGHQESVTAGTIFQRTRTSLRKWFLAAWWMARDKRGVSALLLSRELGLRYETAWLMAHKLRHALTERPEFPLEGLVEVDESYYGGRGKPESRGRGLANPNKSLLVMAVEKRPVGPGKGIKASGFVAGHARLAILPAANARELGGFVRAAVRPESRLVSDDFKG